jgi:hypothetical protein
MLDCLGLFFGGNDAVTNWLTRVTRYGAQWRTFEIRSHLPLTNAVFPQRVHDPTAANGWAQATPND